MRVLRRVLLGALASGLLVLGACGDSSGGDAGPSSVAGGAALPADTLVVRASSDLAVGQERLLVALATPRNERLGGPDVPIEIELAPADDPAAATTYPATFTWAIPDVSGLYRAEVEFDRPGVWLAQVVPTAGEALEPVALQVNETSTTPAVGTTAPPTDTPTAADVADLAEISTDRAPDPRFYELSIAEAVTSGRPSVIVFATPRFCQTAVCGPTLDEVKQMAPSYPDVNFVHVEIFTNLDDPDALEVVPAVRQWGLPSEPWVFVVAADGTIAGRFEGVVDPAEIDAALAA